MRMKSAFLIASLLLILSVLHSSCHKGSGIYGFNFEKNWSWTDLRNHATTPETLQKIDTLEEYLTIEEAHTLFKNVSGLKHPADIEKLFEIQSLQDSLGGSFYGLAPVLSREADRIPIPGDFDGIISTGLFLATFRAQNYEAISKTEYPIIFTNKSLELHNPTDYSSNIAVAFDISAIQQILDAFTKDQLTIDDAVVISQLSAFTQMLNHRRSLGYLPEPLPTEQSLAQFIFLASQDEPLLNLWKWLSPWNYFNLSDLYTNQERYSTIVTELQRNENSIGAMIANQIEDFVPHDFKFADTISLAINWGIRSWATNRTLGTNIAQFKDDYDLLIQTITHETFHRVQLQLCSSDKTIADIENIEFEDIVYYPFTDKKDRKFYEVLSYIFLEGTASYVGGMDPSKTTMESVKSGTGLLNEIYQKIYLEDELEEIDELINSGLISNGPFYSLGYHLTKHIVLHGEPDATRSVLINGPLDFLITYIELNFKTNTLLDGPVRNKIIELAKYD